MLNRCAACVIKGDYHTCERWRARGPTVFRNRYPRYTRPRLLLITIPTWLFYNLVREITPFFFSFFFFSIVHSFRYIEGREWAGTTKRVRGVK